MVHRLCELPLNVANYKGEYDYIQQTAKVNGYRTSVIDREVQSVYLFFSTKTRNCSTNELNIRSEAYK